MTRTTCLQVHNKRARIAESEDDNSRGLLVFPHNEKVAQREGKPLVSLGFGLHRAEFSVVAVRGCNEAAAATCSSDGRLRIRTAPSLCWPTRWRSGTTGSGTCAHRTA